MFYKIKNWIYLIPLMFTNISFATSTDDCSGNYAGISVDGDGFKVSRPCLVDSTGGNNFSGAAQSTSEQFLRIFSYVCAGGCIVSLIILTWGAVQLAGSAGNQRKKDSAYQKIKSALIAIAVIGGITAIANLAYSLFK